MEQLKAYNRSLLEKMRKTTKPADEPGEEAPDTAAPSCDDEKF
jgi:hypothetical protein